MIIALAETQFSYNSQECISVKQFLVFYKSKIMSKQYILLLVRK